MQSYSVRNSNQSTHDRRWTCFFRASLIFDARPDCRIPSMVVVIRASQSLSALMGSRRAHTLSLGDVSWSGILLGQLVRRAPTSQGLGVSPMFAYRSQMTNGKT